MSKKISLILIISGVALLLFACGLFVYNQIYDYTAGRRAQELLDDIMAGFEWDLPPIEEMAQSSTIAADSVMTSEEISEDGRPAPVRPLVVREPRNNGTTRSDGASGNPGEWAAPQYDVIGVISIPKLGVQLPVINESSNELLNISCCRLSGIVDVKPIRLVIAGHNLKSHFGGLDTLELGDEIAFTTLDGVTYYYSAVEISAIHKSDGADVLATDGWDITLLTCKTDRTMRTMVRFAEIITNPETEAAAAPDETAEIDEINETAGVPDAIETAEINDTAWTVENDETIEAGDTAQANG